MKNFEKKRGGSQLNFLDEIIVDNFAGGGGASTGMELATGRPVAIAINHDPDAILMHRTNHPYTEHLQASVWDVDPREVCRGRPVGLAWFSPDCKHFSKAKGAALVDRNIRGLAWIVLRWAGTVRPRVIILENVEEFVTWGPVRKGKPVKKKAGQTFQKWKRQLLELGYQVEHREIVAADLGAPTTRKRFVLVARCDGRPIVWPERTHGPRDSEEVRDGRLMPWKSAAEIIDWSVPCYSVFASKRELKEKYGVNAVRPLADNTMRRVIRGVDKFTIRSGRPFIVECNHGGDGHARSTEEPVNTVTRKYTGGICAPALVPFTFSNTGVTARNMRSGPVTTQTRNWSARSASMERLTIRNSDGSVSQPTGLNWAAALERLAAYEDTGLEPCEISEKYATIMAFNRLRLKISLARLCEILQAETEGRCVVLPCMIGDTLNKCVNQAREFEELYTKLYAVTGFTAEKLLEMFAAGYVLQKPDYSKQLAEMANLAETTTPNELPKRR